MIRIYTEQVIDCQDWDTLVQETYGRPYCLQQQDGCMPRGKIYITAPSVGNPFDYENDSVPEEVNGKEMGVSFAAWLARDSDEWNGEDRPGRRKFMLQLFWHRNFYPSLDMVVEDLFKRGLLPAGEYVINIDW